MSCIYHFFVSHVDWDRRKMEKKNVAKLKNKKLLRIVNTDLLAFSLDWRTGPIFIVCCNAFTDSRPGCSAHFSLTAFRILPNVWFSKRNKQKMGCNCSKKSRQFSLFLLRSCALNLRSRAYIYCTSVLMYVIHVHVAPWHTEITRHSSGNKQTLWYTMNCLLFSRSVKPTGMPLWQSTVNVFMET